MSSPDPSEAEPGRPRIRWLWTSNPFYIISAGLFLFGLYESFGARNREVDTWALMGGLAGYTLLLAGAALLLVRFARVWNDVRTVLLLVVLMFLATSVTFDELLVFEPERGTLFNVGGLGFAIFVSEGLLRGIRLRLPMLFRLPYHLTLCLFFLYPVALVRLLKDPYGEAMMWGLWGFSATAGVVFLTLLPAIRRGTEYVRDNGSPWPWPFYPWSLFVFLAVAVCGRTFLLCWSLHQPLSMGELVFGPHFLVPFGFALVVIVLELGIVQGHRVTRWVALVAPVGLVVLAGVGHRADAASVEFLGHFANRLGGSPLFVALVAATGFYLYAWVRRVPLALEGLTVAVGALAIIGPETLTVASVSGVRAGPLVAALGIQVLLALWRRDGWRLVVGGLVAAIWLSDLAWRWYRVLREDVPGVDYIVAGLALLPVAVLISLGKAGVITRWWNAGREERVATDEHG